MFECNATLKQHLARIAFDCVGGCRKQQAEERRAAAVRRRQLEDEQEDREAEARRAAAEADEAARLAELERIRVSSMLQWLKVAVSSRRLRFLLPTSMLTFCHISRDTNAQA